MRAVAGTRWLGVVILLSLAGSGVILITRLSDPDDALLHLLLTQLPITATAAAATPVLSAVLGVGLGLVTAHRGGWVDQTMRALVITGLGLCLGWAVLLGGFWFALHTELMSMLADERTAMARIALLSTLLLPATAVLLGAALAISVHVRSAARAVSLEGFVRTARLRGLPTTGLVLRRVLRRTLPAILTVLAAELIVVYCGALIVQAVYTRASLPADLPLLPAGSLPVVLGFAVAAAIGILVVALATAMRRGLAPVDGWRTEPGGRGAHPVPEMSLPSTGFRSADLLDIRDLRIHQAPEQPWAEEPGPAGPGDSINLTVARGEAVAIIGDHSSGAGQLCRAIVGLLPVRTPVRSGSILFDGRELVGLPEREFRRLRGAKIGILDSPSSHRLDPRVRVGKALTGILATRPGASRSGAREAALQLLRRVGIDTVEDVFAAYPHQLSAETAGRVLLAGAIGAEPELLIAFEPTLGFDSAAETEVLDLLHDLHHERGFTLIVISTRMEVVARCERVAVMRAGTIVEHASASDLLANPQHPHSQYLLTGPMTLPVSFDD